MTDERPPCTDIDVLHHVDYLRIERMDEDSIWIAAYNDDDDADDYQYWFECDENGLRVIAEEEYDAEVLG